MKKKIVSLLLAGTLALTAAPATAPAGAAETAGETAEAAGETEENAGETEENAGETEDALEQRYRECGVCDIAADKDGSLLAADSCNKVIWRFRDGAAERYAGMETEQDLYGVPIGGYVDGSLEESTFGLPWAIVPFLDGFAVSDAVNNAVRLVRETGVETVNGSTKEPLTVTEMGVAFDYPTGLAADDKGNLYVSDTRKGAVRRISKDGVVTTAADELKDPMGLYWSKGTLYIAETGENRIVELNQKTGEKKVLAGSGESGDADGPALKAQFAGPQRITGDEEGTLYISDSGNGCVRCIADGQVTTMETEEQLYFPAGMLVQEETLLICDSFMQQIYQVELGETP